MEQRERISLMVEVGNTRPGRFHLKAAETPAADALLETKEQQRMKWCLKHWGAILLFQFVLNTDQINAHMQGMYARLQICSTASWSTAGERRERVDEWFGKRVSHVAQSWCRCREMTLFYVQVEASPVAVPFYDRQQNTGIHAL